MNVCLINPAWLFGSRHDIIISHNLGLGYLAAYLREKGTHHVSIIDALAKGISQIEVQPDGLLRVGLSDRQIIQAVPNDTDLIGITVPFSHLSDTVERLCQSIKKVRPDVPVILGGVHPSTCHDEFPNSSADYWLVGEGEQALLRLANGDSPDDIPGLLTRSKPTLNPDQALTPIHNLDDIPFPARDLLPMTDYLGLSQRRIRHKPSSSIITSRGCPWNCQFCSIHPIYGYRWRKRSAENVLAEIQELVEAWGVRQLEIEDDNLTLHRTRAAAIFEGLCKLQKTWPEKLTWGTPNGIRAETVDRELLQLMKRSGCVRVTYALEHGDPDVRQSMNKKLDIDKFENAVRSAIDVGLHVEIFNMVGYPGETRQRFENALRYYKKLSKWGVHTLHFFVPQPYPGTQLYRSCKENGSLVSDQYSLSPPVKIETEDFDTDEVLRRREQLVCEFDKTYRLRQRIKTIVPPSLIDTINRLIPRKSM